MALESIHGWICYSEVTSIRLRGESIVRGIEALFIVLRNIVKVFPAIEMFFFTSKDNAGGMSAGIQKPTISKVWLEFRWLDSMNE